jgi:hypothetical protein
MLSRTGAVVQPSLKNGDEVVNEIPGRLMDDDFLRSNFRNKLALFTDA